MGPVHVFVVLRLLGGFDIRVVVLVQVIVFVRHVLVGVRVAASPVPMRVRMGAVHVVWSTRKLVAHNFVAFVNEDYG